MDRQNGRPTVEIEDRTNAGLKQDTLGCGGCGTTVVEIEDRTNAGLKLFPDRPINEVIFEVEIEDRTNAGLKQFMRSHNLTAPRFETSRPDLCGAEQFGMRVAIIVELTQILVGEAKQKCRWMRRDRKGRQELHDLAQSTTVTRGINDRGRDRRDIG